jgi:transcription elongation factor Elf1
VKNVGQMLIKECLLIPPNPRPDTTIICWKNGKKILALKRSKRLERRKMNCPRCDEELNCDEVDIGVGTLQGNYHCDSCGWSEQEILDNLLMEEK